MNTLQLPNFKNHPECAAGAITLDQAAMMIRRGWLTHDGARFLLPPRAWALLPKPAQAVRVQRGGWMQHLRNVRSSLEVLREQSGGN
jgi:hypothetical protein